jgi:hypothetical protein
MEMAGFSQNVKDRVDYLRQSHELHTELFQKLAASDEGRIFGVDLVAWAVLNRSLSLIDGFSMIIESGNILCAGALLRMQLDSAMRLHACWLVEDPHTLVEPLLTGRGTVIAYDMRVRCSSCRGPRALNSRTDMSRAGWCNPSGLCNDCRARRDQEQRDADGRKQRAAQDRSAKIVETNAGRETAFDYDSISYLDAILAYVVMLYSDSAITNGLVGKSILILGDCRS